MPLTATDQSRDLTAEQQWAKLALVVETARGCGARRD
jgi:hypothetical protein